MIGDVHGETFGLRSRVTKQPRKDENQEQPAMCASRTWRIACNNEKFVKGLLSQKPVTHDDGKGLSKLPAKHIVHITSNAAISYKGDIDETINYNLCFAKAVRACFAQH